MTALRVVRGSCRLLASSRICCGEQSGSDRKRQHVAFDPRFLHGALTFHLRGGTRRTVVGRHTVSVTASPMPLFIYLVATREEGICELVLHDVWWSNSVHGRNIHRVTRKCMVLATPSMFGASRSVKQWWLQLTSSQAWMTPLLSSRVLVVCVIFPSTAQRFPP